MSQRALSAASGVHWVSIARIESQGVQPRLETLHALSRALRIPVSRFVNAARGA